MASSSLDQLPSNESNNYFKGVLAYTFLKLGLEPYIGILVDSQHDKILRKIGITPIPECTTCTLKDLKLFHRKNPTDNKCPKGQKNCNCLHRKNKKKCRNKVCHIIHEQILKAHASSPPSPEWRNTDITKWTTEPWEIAKCFINANGYSEKKSAEEIDCSGLLHLILNNRYYQEKLEKQTVELLEKMLTRRNTLFHLPSPEMNDQQLNEIISDILKILEDPTLKFGAAKAVEKVNGLKNQKFTLTSQADIEICKTELGVIKPKLQEVIDAVENFRNNLEVLRKKQPNFRRSESLRCFKNDLRFSRRSLRSFDTNLLSLQADLKISENDLRSFQDELQTEKQGFIELQSRPEFTSVHRTILQETHKEESRRRLVNLYRKNIVKTSASPLKEMENEIDIRDVYVPPLMTKEIKENKKSKTVTISNYNEIFENNGNPCKKIYVTGNVGSGKSAFCKMMISYYCQSASEDDIRETNQQRQKYDDINVKKMKAFHFMFYIPLRRTRGISNLRKMIHSLYRNIIREDILNHILEQSSEQCLILADGLDEWDPGQQESQHVHLTNGIPDDSDILATIVFTSRSSAPCILNLKSTEYDQTLTLHGIPDASVDLFVSHYSLKLTDSLHVSSLLGKIELMKFAQFENSPLMLQQIVWLLCNGKEVGNSVCDVFTCVINIAFIWMESKFKENNKSFDLPELGRVVENCKLPRYFETYPCCKTYGQFMFVFGKIAFELLLQCRESTTILGRHALKTQAINDTVITALLTTGIIKEENCFDPSSETSQVSFVHTFYIKYFVAIYMVIHSDTIPSQTLSTGVQCTNDVLAKLFGVYKTLEDVLKLENSIAIACRLSSDKTLNIFQHIYKTVSKDWKTVKYRTHYLQNKNEHFEFKIKLPELFLKLQILYVQCMSDYQLANPSSVIKIPLLDILINRKFKQSELLKKYVDPQKVLHVYISADEDFLETVLEFENLQTIAVDYHVKLEHSTLLLLSKFLSKSTSLRNISLRQVLCKKCYSSCNHVIDLSGHCHLETLHNVQCSKILSLQVLQFANIDTSQLEYFETFTDNSLRSVKNAQRLKILKLNSLTYTTTVHEVILSLDKLEELLLINLNIQDNVLQMKPEMCALRYIKLCNVKITLSCWEIFINCLLKLNQSVTVERTIANHYSVSEDAFEMAIKYVKERNLKILEQAFYYIKFSKEKRPGKAENDSRT